MGDLNKDKGKDCCAGTKFISRVTIIIMISILFFSHAPKLIFLNVFLMNAVHKLW